MNKALTLFIISALLPTVAVARPTAALEQLQAEAGAEAPAAEPVGEPQISNRSSGHYECTGNCVPGSYAAQAGVYRALPNYITMHAAPPPVPMDWTTLSRLAGTTLRSEYAVKFKGQNHIIGHISFEVGCTLPDGTRKYAATGQSSVGLGGFADLVKQGAGYGAFFGYVEGRMQTQAELEKDYDRLSSQDDELSLMTFKISQASCLEALRYVQAYVDEGVYKRYGLGVRPLYGEGGGCANVGVSVLQVAGPADFAGLSAPWSRTLYLPQALIGEPGKKVSVWKVLKQRRQHWLEKPSEPYKELFFYDPEPMHYWIKDAYAAGYAASAKKPVERYTINKAPGVILDYTAETSPTAWWLHD